MSSSVLLHSCPTGAAAPWTLPLPSALVSGARVRRVVKTVQSNGAAVSLRRTSGTLTLCIEDGAASLERLRRAFLRDHGLPVRLLNSDERQFQPSDDPVVSCIVVCTHNLPFVASVLVPSLGACAPPDGMEVILVSNGPTSAQTGSTFGPACRHVRAPFSRVAAAYNVGLRHARAPFVAFFHDDCLVTHPEWFLRAREALQAGAKAVTPERPDWQGLPVAKPVPLVMRRSTGRDLEGFDEGFVVGLEDVDLSMRLQKRDWPVEEVKLGTRHFQGMSTVLAFGGEAPDHARLFGLLAADAGRIRRQAGRAVRNVRRDPVYRRVLAAGTLYFLQKHAAALDALDPDWRDVRARQYDRCRLLAELRPDLTALVHDPLRLDAYLRRLHSRADEAG